MTPLVVLPYIVIHIYRYNSKSICAMKRNLWSYIDIFRRTSFTFILMSRIGLEIRPRPFKITLLLNYKG